MLTKKDFEKVFTNPQFDFEEAFSYQLTAADMSHFEKNLIDLRYMIANEKLAFDARNDVTSTKGYELLEEICQISISTMKKTISGGKNKDFMATRNFLYKFTVGLGMSVEKANTFFALCGGKLNPERSEDFICLDVLEHKEDVFMLINEMQRLAKVNIALREREGK